MYIACEKCKYNDDGECGFYDMGSDDELYMPCYREKELIKEAANNFLQAFIGAESEEQAQDVEGGLHVSNDHKNRCPASGRA